MMERVQMRSRVGAGGEGSRWISIESGGSAAKYAVTMRTGVAAAG